MKTPARITNNLFARRPLLIYFVLAFAFFWGFLTLAIAGIGLLGLSPTTVPGWLFSCFNIIGAWMPNLAGDGDWPDPWLRG